MEKLYTIITHNGKFHADEIMAYNLLNILYPNNNLIRTRNNRIIETGNIIIDVGLKYIPEDSKFDHHQFGCRELFNNSFDVPLSSCGMVYKHYGKEIIRKIISEEIKNIVEENIDDIYLAIYENIIMEIDAIDNGLRYRGPGIINFSSLIGMMNNDDHTDDDKQLTSFKNTSLISTKLFKILTDFYIHQYFKNKEKRIKIHNAMKKRFEYDQSGQTLVINLPQNDDIFPHILHYERRNPCDNKIKFLISNNGYKWRITSINHKNRKRINFPKKYTNLATAISKTNSFEYVTYLRKLMLIMPYIAIGVYAIIKHFT